VDAGSAQADWAALDAPWRLAFEEAWASWCAGNFGIGAVLIDGDDILSAGRNRVTERAAEAGTLAGNFMAHAEMNAFAGLDRFWADGLHLYTTLEPCLMCAATTILMNVDHVHFAARDEFFEGLDDLWSQHWYTRERRPERTGPLPGTLARFARVLPLSFMSVWNPDSAAATRVRDAEPELADLAATLPTDSTLVEIKHDGTVSDAYAHLRDRL
jgi:tRNA(Arg) A34 adenosine deaminase TadA